MKADFHTHSATSPDGGIRKQQYRKLLNDQLLDFVAITDHNSITFALELGEEFSNKVIVGEEIMTTDGEIIGLFIGAKVSPGLTPKETADEIKKQGGLVYIPHPFETVRSGITASSLDDIKGYVDIIEVHNGRAVFQNFSSKAIDWATKNGVAMAASSDAHGLKGIGATYSVLGGVPDVTNLVELLKNAKLVNSRPPLRTLLYPKANKLRKLISKK